MEIKKGTVVVCNHLLKEATLGIVQEVTKENVKVKIFWPENIQPQIIFIANKALVPLCNDIDDLTRVAKFAILFFEN